MNLFYYLKLQIHCNPYTTARVTGYLNSLFSSLSDSQEHQARCVWFCLYLFQPHTPAAIQGQTVVISLSSLSLSFPLQTPHTSSTFALLIPSLAPRSAAWSMNTGVIKRASNCTFEIQRSVSPRLRNAAMTPDKAKHPLYPKACLRLPHMLVGKWEQRK